PVEHVRLADRADLLVVAPATAHTIAKLANGLADDFLSTFYLSHRGPVLLAPAMESAMWEQPAVRSNCERLAGRGVRFVGPGSGFLASGHEGVGRMAEPSEIVDAVRFVSNRSSGRMGYALAEAARDRGADVTLLSGPTGLPSPEGVRFVPFETADDLHARLLELFPDSDGLAMAAAVSDFVPEARRERLHRSEGDATVRLAAG